MVWVIVTIAGLVMVASLTLPLLLAVLFVSDRLLQFLPFGRLSRFVSMMLKSLRRNLVRTSLTYLATFVLVLVVTLVWSALLHIEGLTAMKTKDLKVIVSDKWSANGPMPFSYARPIGEGAADPSHSDDIRPQDSMSWQIYIGSMDNEHKNPEDLVFCMALEPRKCLTFLDSLFEEFSPSENQRRPEKHLAQVGEFQKYVDAMEKNKRALVVGQDRLKKLNKRVGERLTLTCINFPGLELEFEIVGVFPRGRYDQLAAMNRDYVNDAIDSYPKTHGGAKHPQADKSLYAVWLQVKNLEEFNRVAEQISTQGHFDNPAVKCETLSSGISTWLEGYNDMMWAMRWFLSPAILATMVLVISNAISISVRERRLEMAVLKVLGYQPGQILTLVLGEAVLIGALSGLLGALFTYIGVDEVLNRLVPLQPIWVPNTALIWGPALGVVTAIVGSTLPALNACKVQVSEVFARVAT
jgi:putative ABC transport system permease protein